MAVMAGIVEAKVSSGPELNYAASTTGKPGCHTRIAFDWRPMRLAPSPKFCMSLELRL